MKYGVHASEAVDDIIVRKQNEFTNCGCFFWGYGGTICHPLKQIAPFLEQDINLDGTYLLLCRTLSDFKNSPDQSKQYSTDGIHWINIPWGISVYGSKYALICKELMPCDFDLDLSSYIVGIGPSSGCLLSNYIRGRVDKGCGVLQHRSLEAVDSPSAHITWYAKISGACLLR